MYFAEYAANKSLQVTFEKSGTDHDFPEPPRLTQVRPVAPSSITQPRLAGACYRLKTDTPPAA